MPRKGKHMGAPMYSDFRVSSWIGLQALLGDNMQAWEPINQHNLREVDEALGFLNVAVYRLGGNRALLDVLLEPNSNGYYLPTELLKEKFGTWGIRLPRGCHPKHPHSLSGRCNKGDKRKLKNVLHVARIINRYYLDRSEAVISPPDAVC